MARRPDTLRRVSASGFTLLEVLVAVAVIGIIVAVALPNFLKALRTSRRTAAIESSRQIEAGLELYMLEHHGPPASVNVWTLEPLVSEGALSASQATALLGAFEGSRLRWYFGVPSAKWMGWGYDYGVAFSPRHEPDASCVMYPEATWCFFPGTGWEVVRE